MKRFIRRWNGTPARRARVASMLAKCAEILFWLVAVGPFATQPRISLPWWLAGVALLAITLAGSYWYSRGREGGVQ